MLRKSIRRATALIIVVVLSTALGVTASANPITGNNSVATAYALGTWSTYMNVPTTVLPDTETEAFYSFRAKGGDRFYIRMGAGGTTSTGMRLELRNSTGTIQLGIDGGVVDRGTITAFRYVPYEVPAGTPSNTLYIIRIFRDPSDPDAWGGQRVFTPSFYNLFQNGNGTFSFSGTATNPGNTSLNPNGTNSTVLTRNLTNEGSIPVGAKVRSVTTKSSMSPSQGNVRHHIGNEGTWYTSIVSSATSGSYNISISNDLDARAVWTFRYNAMATGASSMGNVSVTINYEYNVTIPFLARLS